MKPRIYIIAGPNGAGKTTFAGKYLPLFTNSRDFVNADDIAARLSPANPAAAAFRAGREMLKRIGELAIERADFALETTLAGRSYLPLLQNFKSWGYEVHLYFLWLPDVELAVTRVADRVRKGGHAIPEEVIRRRYKSGVANLFQHYRTVCDGWTLFDNSGPLLYTIAAATDESLVVLDEGLFAQFSKMGKDFQSERLKEQAEIPEWVKAVIAMRLAMREVVEEHARTGRPLLTWRDGKLFRLQPEDARRELEQAEKNDPWVARVLSVGSKG